MEKCQVQNVGMEKCQVQDVGMEKFQVQNVGMEKCKVQNVGMEKCQVQSVGMMENYFCKLSSAEVFQKIGRSVFVYVDLDVLVHNMTIMSDMCQNKKAGRVVVVKGNAYGHGAVAVSRYLLSSGAADRLAVATVDEAVQLRKAGIIGIIHVLGNVQSWEMSRCVRYGLIPTVSSELSIIGMAKCIQEEEEEKDDNIKPSSINCDNNCTDINQRCSNLIEHSSRKKSSVAPGTVHIKVDSGMSRNGCQTHELPRLVQTCKKHRVPLEGIFSMLCNTEDVVYTEKQVNTFQQCIEPYRNDGYLFHMANSAAILANFATDMDLVRPGIALYGLSPGVDLDSFIKMGFKPALCVKATPTLVKKCSAGTPVGYGCMYTCETDEWLATFPIGYADGFWRELGEGRSYVIRDKTGEKCLVVGRVSMDAITVRLPCQPDAYELFTMVTSDYDPMTSVTGLAKRLGTIENEILVRLSDRLPRVYRTTSSELHCIMGALHNDDHVTNGGVY